MSVVLSDEQNHFIDIALKGNNILVDACIGSGKTTAIQRLCDLIPEEKRVLYLTYNRLLKLDAKERIHRSRTLVTNYHGFAHRYLSRDGIKCGISDLIQKFNEVHPELPTFDVLIIDEYQDIEQEMADMLVFIKEENPDIQIIAVGDMEQKIYDKTTLNVPEFMNSFLGKYEKMTFTLCFRLNQEHAAMLGRVWGKTISGVNTSCVVEQMSIDDIVDFLASQNTGDVLCLGARKGGMATVLNILESKYPEKYNKKTVYASISDDDSIGKAAPRFDSAIFTTFDSSKGLERKICVIFDFTENYWQVRIDQPSQSYEILRNIFCVAASRGKEKIIFVNEKEQLLEEKTISTKTENDKKLKLVEISGMFDFKYRESIEQCFSYLRIKELATDDNTVIDIKTTDALIDLSPCVGIFQEASFFNDYDIAKDIETYLKVHKEANLFGVEYDKGWDVKKQILYYTALETSQQRYFTQVSPAFVSDCETQQLHKRLKSVFTESEDVQVPCSISFNQFQGFEFDAIGLSDVVKDNIVYELKFVSELTHEHFLQCALYVVAHRLEKGILWNTRTNSKFEIKVKNVKDFLKCVAETVLKKTPPSNKAKKPEHSQSSPSVKTCNAPVLDSVDKNSDYFAVIDTETNWSDEVMSIGITVADKSNFEIAHKSYYVIEPECNEDAMYASSLYHPRSGKPIKCDRKTAIESIKQIIQNYNISDAFAYNANFDMRHLPELSEIDWYDIMKVAAYRQYNKKLPDNLEFCKTGRLKRDYGVEPITSLLTGNRFFAETHNALLDAIDELNIMKMLEMPFSDFAEIARISECTSEMPTALPVSNRISPKSKKVPLKSQENDDSKQELKFIEINSRTSTIGTTTTSTEYKTSQSVSKTVIIDTTETKVKKPEIKYLTAKEAAKELNISYKKILQLINNGDIEALKKNGRYYISEKSIAMYMELLQNIKQLAVILTIFAIGALLFLACVIGFR